MDKMPNPIMRTVRVTDFLQVREAQRRRRRKRRLRGDRDDAGTKTSPRPSAVAPVGHIDTTGPRRKLFIFPLAM